MIRFITVCSVVAGLLGCTVTVTEPDGTKTRMPKDVYVLKEQHKHQEDMATKMSGLITDCGDLNDPNVSDVEYNSCRWANVVGMITEEKRFDMIARVDAAYYNYKTAKLQTILTFAGPIVVPFTQAATQRIFFGKDSYALGSGGTSIRQTYNVTDSRIGGKTVGGSGAPGGAGGGEGAGGDAAAGAPSGSADVYLGGVGNVQNSNDVLAGFQTRFNNILTGSGATGRNPQLNFGGNPSFAPTNDNDGGNTVGINPLSF